MSTSGRTPSTPIRPFRIQAPITPSSSFTPEQRQRRRDLLNAASKLNPTSRMDNINAGLRGRTTNQVLTQRPDGSTASAHDAAAATLGQGRAHQMPGDIGGRSPPPKRSRTDDCDAEYDTNFDSEPPSPVRSLHSAGVQADISPGIADSRQLPPDEELVIGPDIDDQDELWDTSFDGDKSISSHYATAPPSPGEPPFGLSTEPVAGPSVPRQPSLSASQLLGLLTPPTSSQLGFEFEGAFSQPIDEAPDSPSKGKGKGRDLGIAAMQRHVPHGEIQKTIKERLRNPSPDDRQTPQSSPPSGPPQLHEQAAADLPTKMQATFSEYIDYVRRLERREKAAFMSNELKMNKIKQLESENEELRRRIRALGATIAALEARR
ncbi:hypothetical protein WOLCODRAFT_138467 [Wolfiporia cocos MD-104 SS10]|uniref:BZIP domain-containing protein n=1 Tax=Wolfiporia cocos (strain MD-104) TaxID=742152 RepID=A0A2H3JN58_WOLCO|nr:hypothetical protein WOLCODRAFT_138467 [Wolfiporia cocos MD-104 SS10]